MLAAMRSSRQNDHGNYYQEYSGSLCLNTMYLHLNVKNNATLILQVTKTQIKMVLLSNIKTLKNAKDCSFNMNLKKAANCYS